MAAKKPTNPFYAAALPIGVLFALTACAYVVMIVQASDPQREPASGLIAILEQRGVPIMLAELAILAVMTIAAIATDNLWTRRLQTAQNRRHPVTLPPAEPNDPHA